MADTLNKTMVDTPSKVLGCSLGIISLTTGCSLGITSLTTGCSLGTDSRIMAADIRPLRGGEEEAWGEKTQVTPFTAFGDVSGAVVKETL